MKLKLLLICLLGSFILNAQEVLRNFARFESNSYEMTKECKLLIDGMLTEIQGSKLLKVELYGHTDSNGNPKENELLSANRVRALKSYLLSKGIEESIFITDHFGETQPAFNNESEDGRKKNRRVEVVFTYQE